MMFYCKDLEWTTFEMEWMQMCITNIHLKCFKNKNVQNTSKRSNQTDLKIWAFSKRGFILMIFSLFSTFIYILKCSRR